MIVKQNLRMDLCRCGCTPMISAVQGEANTRVIVLALYANGAAWDIPDGSTAVVAFQKPDGKKGIYDKLPDGSAAVTLADSVAEATLAPQVLTAAGRVTVSVNFHDKDGDTLATFPFTVAVEPNPAVDAEASEDYFNYVNPLITEALEEAGTAAAAATAAAARANAASSLAYEANEKVEALREVVSKFHSNIVETASGEVVTISDASDLELSGLKIYGRTTQNGTPSPEAPIPLESVGADGSIAVKVGTSETDENMQTLHVPTPNGLPGIPVTSGGNYTDSNGQQWLCDEVDLEKNQYVQRVKEMVFDGTAGNYNSGIQMYQLSDVADAAKKAAADNFALCAKYPFSSAANADMPDKHCKVHFTSTKVNMFIKDLNYTSKEAWLAYLSANPVTILYQLEEEKPRELTEAEKADYTALHTNYPNTTIFTDEGACMEVKYVADTKLYIDKKFDQLAQAMLNN